jgi:N-acetylmuramoyl-L-alanine amidase
MLEMRVWSLRLEIRPWLGIPLRLRTRARLVIQPSLAALWAMAALVLAGCGREATGAIRPGAAPSAERTVAGPGAAASASQSAAGPGRMASAKARAMATAPKIHWDPIPFPASRKREMVAYARRHYGLDTYRLIDPHVIVEHYTETPDFASTYNTFAPDHPDSELHELPNTCAHFVVDRDGAIHQLVPLGIMCRHTVGLNYTAIGIENVGYSDREILEDHAEMRASLMLTRWLRCRYGMALENVIGHNESLSSPYHHENVTSLRTQTHDDWRRADMNVYRARLRVLPCR